MIIIKVKYYYDEPFLPTKRHKKYRYREAVGKAPVKLHEVSREEAPVAFRVVNETVDYETGKEIQIKTDYRLFNNELWTLDTWRNHHAQKTGLITIDDVVNGLQRPERRPGYYDALASWCDESEALSSLHKTANRYIFIDGYAYVRAGEPRYVVMTFGLGHNHGGTALMVNTFYNSNIHRDRYYNALQRNEAIAEALRVAEARGDTKDLDPKRIEHKRIEVLIPEAVKCNPQAEHGEGDPFINKLNAISESTDSTAEAGAMSILTLVSELKDE